MARYDGYLHESGSRSKLNLSGSHTLLPRFEGMTEGVQRGAEEWWLAAPRLSALHHRRVSRVWPVSTFSLERLSNLAAPRHHRLASISSSLSHFDAASSAQLRRRTLGLVRDEVDCGYDERVKV